MTTFNFHFGINTFFNLIIKWFFCLQMNSVPMSPPAGSAAAGGAGPAGVAADAAGRSAGADGRGVCQRGAAGQLVPGWRRRGRHVIPGHRLFDLSRFCPGTAWRTHTAPRALVDRDAGLLWALENSHWERTGTDERGDLKTDPLSRHQYLKTNRKNC